MAKQRLFRAIDKVQVIPAVKTETLVAKALSNTMRELLVAAGVTTHKGFYDMFADKMENQAEKMYDALGIEEIVLEDADDEADLAE